MTTPNIITTLRLPLQAITLFLLLIHNSLTSYALILYSINILLDKVDGILARKNNQVTDFGKYYDIATDRAIQITTLLTINHILQGSLIIPIILIISRDFLLTGIRQFSANKNLFLKGSKFGKTKAIFEMLGIYSGLIYLLSPSQIILNLNITTLYLASAIGFFSLYKYIKDNYSLIKNNW